MRSQFLSKLRSAFALLSLLLVPSSLHATITMEEAAKLLPNQIGEWRAAGKPYIAGSMSNLPLTAEGLKSNMGIRRAYVSPRGEKADLGVGKTSKESEAYALLTQLAQFIKEQNASNSQPIRTGEVGTASISFPPRLHFIKGAFYVSVQKLDISSSDEAMLAFARLYAEGLDKGDGDIPVLVKHLPEWEKVQGGVAYAVNQDQLREVLPNRPVLDAVSFEGGAEAVTATYGASRLVIIENTTPQLATDNDARIQGRIRELREQGQSVPTAYQRVGNYSVLVFDAPDEQTAMQLIKGITYEQTVQWLGNNPRALERAQRQYTETTANIILAVLKASGLSILLCLGIGGLFGGLVFRHRRAQQAASTAYSDAGDMVRLNIDGMTAQNDPARLLGRSDS